MNFILCSPDSSFWETDFSSFLVLYVSPLWLPVAPSSYYSFHWCRKLHLAPQPCVCCDHGQSLSATVVGRRWFGAAWPTGETREDYVSEASVLCWRCLVGIRMLSCTDGNKLVWFPRQGGWDGQRASHSSLWLWVPRGREDWGKPSHHF